MGIAGTGVITIGQIFRNPESRSIAYGHHMRSIYSVLYAICGSVVFVVELMRRNSSNILCV
jgi:hypothetical protein